MGETASVRKKRIWIYGAVFLIAFVLSYLMFYRETQKTVSSDIVTHMKYALSLDRVLSLTHCGWQFVCWLFYACLPITISEAAALVTALFNGATALLITWLSEAYIGKRMPKGSLYVLLTLVILLVGPLYLRFYNPNYYKGQGTPNIWHNPTAVAVKPLMILIDVLTIGYWECRARARRGVRTEQRVMFAQSGNGMEENAARAKGIREEKMFRSESGGRGKAARTGAELVPTAKKLRCYQWVLAVLLAFSVLIKPSFLMAYLPVCGIAELWRLLKNREGAKGWGDAVLKNLYFLPGLCIFLWQYLKIFIIGGEVSGEGGIEIAFFKLARMQAPSVLVSLGLKMAFPILVMVIWRKKLRKDRLFPLLFGQFLAGLAITWTFIETGRRASHGNFGWSNVLAASFIWIFCIIFYFRELLEDGEKIRTDSRLKWKYGIPLLFLVWHFLAGICYYWGLLNDMGRQL